MNYALFYPRGLEEIYQVPVIDKLRIDTSNSHPYGAITIEIIVNPHIDDIDITFALSGISPVSRNFLTWFPNNLFSTTNL